MPACQGMASLDILGSWKDLPGSCHWFCKKWYQIVVFSFHRHVHAWVVSKWGISMQTAKETCDSCCARFIGILWKQNSSGIRNPEQARALDHAGMTYIESHIKISRMSFLKPSSIKDVILCNHHYRSVDR